MKFFEIQIALFEFDTFLSILFHEPLFFFPHFNLSEPLLFHLLQLLAVANVLLTDITLDSLYFLLSSFLNLLALAKLLLVPLFDDQIGLALLLFVLVKCPPPIRQFLNQLSLALNFKLGLPFLELHALRLRTLRNIVHFHANSQPV